MKVPMPPMTAVILDGGGATLKASAGAATTSGAVPRGDHMSQSASRSLRVGDHAPLFTLPNQKGVRVSLEAALAKGPVLLGFHRGTW